MTAENYQVPKLTLDEAAELRELVRERKTDLERTITLRATSPEDVSAERYEEAAREHRVVESLERKL